MRRQATRCPEHDNCTVTVPLDDAGHQLWAEAIHTPNVGLVGEGFNLPPEPIHEGLPAPQFPVYVTPHVELAGPSRMVALVCSIGAVVVSVAALVVALMR